MKKLTIILILALAVLLPAAALCAAEEAKAPDFWISPDGTLTPDAVSYNKTDDGYYLLLPGNMDTGKMCFGVAEGVRFTFGGREISTGDSAEGLKTGDYPVTIGKKSITLHVKAGSPGLPVLHITTESGDLRKVEFNKANKEPGRLVMKGPDGGIQYNGDLEHIKMRGNSSRGFPKRSYQIKLKTGTSLMGMGKAKKWILTSNYRDKTHIRNQMLFDLAEAIGLPYTPAHCAAEVYINYRYRGLYLLSEKIEIDDDRVDIADLEKATAEVNEEPLSSYKISGKKGSARGEYKAAEIPNNPEDISGGYLLEYETYTVRYKSENCAYTTKRGIILVVKEPEYASREQMEYITGLAQAFENAINAEDGRDPVTGKHYTEIADEESMMLKYMIEELSENYDGNSSSLYLFKPADRVSEKIFFGPVWDYDSTFGTHAAKKNAKYVLNPASLWIAETDRKTGWFPALWKQQDFRAKVASLWKGRVKQYAEVLLGTRKKEKVPGAENLRSIDEYAAAIEASVEMDRIRWPRINTRSTSVEAWTGVTFEDNIRFLKNYLQKRIEFLDKAWGAKAK